MSFVGIDIGSSAVKAAAYRDDGSALAQAAEAVPSQHPSPGASEVDAERVWAAVQCVVRQVTAADAVHRDPPRAIAVSASGRESFPATADGTPLGQCLRTADDRQPATSISEMIVETPEQWIRDCGHLPDHMDPASRLIWWTEQEPGTMAQARWFLGWHEMASLRLTGRPTIDPALAAGFALFDLGTRQWSSERIAAAAVDPSVLPEVVPWATPLGKVRPEQADELGLPRDCQFVTGSWDGSCAAVGAGVVDAGTALVAAGTWESVVAPLARPKHARVARYRLALTPQPSTPGLGLWARSPNGTSVLDWALALTGMPLDQLEPALAGSGPDPAPVVLVPHLAGAPGPWRSVPGSTGAAFGLTLATSATDIIRATLEGIALELTFAITALRSAGCRIGACRVTGGGARSPWWLQLKADLLGLPVEVSGQEEPGTLGAALLAGLGAGAYGSLTEAASLAAVARVFEPDASRAERYQGRLALHRSLVPGLLARPVRP